MCFSAAASFLTAGLTGTIGAVALAQTTERRQWPLATIPMLFALQQAAEGLLWLTLPVAPDSSPANLLVTLYLLFAEVFWPVYVPLAVLILEQDKKRRHLMLACLAAGIVAGGHLLWQLATKSPSAVIFDGHIVYLLDNSHSELAFIAYIVATGLAPMMSSRRAIALFGFSVLAGSVVAYNLYWQSFLSVWCFFAAAASMLILYCFAEMRRHRFATRRG